MAVTKPDATVFDNADDSIATSRAELHTLATSFNTIADDYNAGLLTQTGDTVDDGINVELETQSAGTQTIHAYGSSHYYKTGGFQTATLGGTTNTLKIPAHTVFEVICTTAGGIFNARIPTGDLLDWKSEDRAPYPFGGNQQFNGGHTSYVGYLTLAGRETNTQDATVNFIVTTSTGSQTLLTETLSPNEIRLYRITVMQDRANADSAGSDYAFVNIEDLTTTATRIETP